MAPHEVVVLVLNDVVAFDLGVPTQIFGAARDGDDRRLYRVRVCTAEVANRAARRSVVPPWRDGGQAQFIERPVPEPAQASTAGARTWALAHLDRAIDVEQLARRAHQSVRTFNRRFREETGQSPGAWLIQQRRVHARHLLESTDLPVDEVARRAGLGSGATLRYHLRESLGVSPVQYRRTFRGRSAS